MKRALIIVAVLGLAASLSAQSLVDLAKREKARRQSVVRHAVIIKNGDLFLVKKVSAVQVTLPEGLAGEEVPSEGTSAGQATIPEDAGLATPPAGAAETPGQTIAGESAADDLAQGREALEEQLKLVEELIDNLTTEMNNLRQQYEAQNTMVPGAVIQQQMQETYQRLSNAQARQAKILERLGRPPAEIKK